jgi:ribonuclease J
VPIHGELRHLHQHGKLACQVGIPEENVAVVENGTPLSFANGELTIGERIGGEHIYVDGALVGEVGPRVIHERDRLGQSGFVTAVVRYDRKKGKPVGRPRIITHGFVFTPDAEDLLARAQDVVRSAASVSPGTKPDKVEDLVEEALSRFFYRETRRRPVVIAAVVKG